VSQVLELLNPVIKCEWGLVHVSHFLMVCLHRIMELLPFNIHWKRLPETLSQPFKLSVKPSACLYPHRLLATIVARRPKATDVEEAPFITTAS
jgi:hypothetical protein